MCCGRGRCRVGVDAVVGPVYGGVAAEDVGAGVGVVSVFVDEGCAAEGVGAGGAGHCGLGQRARR